MRENALDAQAGELAQDLPALTAAETLEDAVGALLRARSGLPVIGADAAEPVGWLTHLDVLRAYNTRLQQGIEHAQGSQAPARRREPARLGSALARLRGYRIVDLELATSGPPVGRQIAEISWPARSTVLAIRRGEHAFEPSERERLECGDRLTVLVPATAADRLADILTADAEQAAAVL